MHDWGGTVREWDDVRTLWLVRLYDDLRRDLPAGFRPRLATLPALELDAGIPPDEWLSRDPRASEPADALPPDETVLTSVR